MIIAGIRAHFVLLLLVLAVPAACQGPAAVSDVPEPAVKPPAGVWQPLFNGKTLEGWKETEFSGRGELSIKDGVIYLGVGRITGITWAGWFPKSNYEVRLEAARIDGRDFFAGITFPVKDSHCTWINGGWGGGVVGLSSLDGQDASENETGLYMEFERGRWYKLRLRVTDDYIEAWIDSDLVIGVLTDKRTISLRDGPIYLSAPFGIASFLTTGALRNLEYRLLPPEPVAPDVPAK
jgi:hypothetical protein